jgi:hypothetical protein
MDARTFDIMEITAKMKVREAVMLHMQKFGGTNGEIHNPVGGVSGINSGQTVRRPEMVRGNNANEPGGY